jgi:glycosyltransferase involved in cell wall biosynthesis
MADPSLSVALCTYNGARYLPAQLESLAGQSQPPDELVVCDDASTDATGAIVREFAARAPFPVRLTINAASLGTTRNFAQAIGLCTGEIIALCDQDDVWHPQKLARYRQTFARYPHAGAVFSDAVVVDQDLRPLGYRLWRYLGFTAAEQRRMWRGEAFEVLLRHNVVLGATLAFRAAFRSLVLPVPAAWAHDRWIPLAIAAVADLLPLRAPLIQYRQHGAQQFGAPRLAWYQRIAAARARDRAHYQALAEQHRAAYECLARVDGPRVARRRLARLAAKAEHYRVRANLPPQRLRRLPTVLRELAAGRYHRYAGGWAGAARDLVC